MLTIVLLDILMIKPNQDPAIAPKEMVLAVMTVGYLDLRSLLGLFDVESLMVLRLRLCLRVRYENMMMPLSAQSQHYRPRTMMREKVAAETEQVATLSWNDAMTSYGTQGRNELRLVESMRGHHRHPHQNHRK
jgi:hypothetical protein